MDGVFAAAGVLGVRVLSHAETPGLGDGIDAQRSDWILGFNGKSLENPELPGWEVRKDGGEFDQLTGATISPRAVTGAVEKGLIWFREKKETILDASAGAPPGAGSTGEAS